MTDSFLDGVLELLVTLAAGVGAAAVTLVGVLAERAGLEALALGHLTLGVWETAVGAVILFVGVYLLGYNQFWQRLRLRIAG